MAGLHDQQSSGGGGGDGGGGYPGGASSGGGGASSGGRTGTSRGVVWTGGHPTWDDFGGRNPDGNGGRDPGGTNIDYVPGHPHPHASGTPAPITGETVPVSGVGSGAPTAGCRSVLPAWSPEERPPA